MARIAKPGISYFSMDSDHIYNSKIKLLFTEYNAHGYWIYQCCLCSIYYGKGYYFNLSDNDDLLLFASDVCKKEVSLVKEVINACVKRGLFDKRVYDVYKVLTSDRIQENYISATEDRRQKTSKITLIKEYLVIEINAKNFKNLEVIPVKNHYSPEELPLLTGKSEFVPPPSTQSKVNESKVNESKVEREKSSNKFSPPSLADVFNFFIEKIPDSSWSKEKCKAQAEKYWLFYDSKNWFVGKNKMVKWKSAASGWISKDKEFTNGRATQQSNFAGNANRAQIDINKPYTKL